MATDAWSGSLISGRENQRLGEKWEGVGNNWDTACLKGMVR